MPHTVGTKELARWFGVEVRQLHRLLDDGVLSLAQDAKGKKIKGRYDPDVNVPAYIALLKKQRRKDTSGEEEYYRLRNVRLANEAAMSELRLRQLRGELIDRRYVLTVMGNLLTSVKNHVLAIPSRVTRLVLGQTNFQRVHEVLKRDHELALREVSDFDINSLVRGGTNNGHIRGDKKKARRAVRRK